MAFELTGLYEASTKDQLHNFLIQLQHSSKRFSSTKAPKNWLDAFQLLMQYIDGLKNKKKKVIFIDEFPWIASARSSFLSAFEHFWNTYCTKRNDLIVVVCGSAASFMINKIIKNKGGLHNRITHKIRLMPFNLQEVKQFLLKKNIKLSNYDILQLYMVMGGVPYYLNHIKKGESVAQNIDRLCFSDHGALVDEFNSVFQSLFSNSEVHQRIIRALAKVKKGVSRKKLLEICGIKSGGVFSKALNELTESGFAIQNKAFSKKTKDSLYSLTDEYSLFYLKFMEQHKGPAEGSWLKLFPKQSYKSWSGLAFESICFKHIDQIKHQLGIAKIYTNHHSWNNQHAQVDLLIDRDDGIINLCEVKFYNDKISLNKNLYLQLKNKLTQFKESTKTKKNIFLCIISTYGVKENSYSLEIVNNKLSMDALFILV